ncbi:MAG: sugar ABC transporter ATP-binding protein [Clostridium sp.]|jgi:ribose transport system ATP-binding protein|nr:sugar ABC transporter ATP-binding protein [Clostridium sp.]
MGNKQDVLLAVRDVVKVFGPVTALNKVNLEVRRGEVLGLIGENGSGKSTVTSIVAGIQPPTSGEMFFQGKPWKPSSMTGALSGGIGMIVQESGVIAGITIAENIVLGEFDRFGKFGFLTKSQINVTAREALRSVGADDIDPSLPAASLDLQDRKIIEIAKVWVKSPEIFIVDETTTAVSQRGRQILYDLMKRQTQAGKSVIFISHDIDEVMEVCDRLTVLRDGNIIRSLPKKEFSLDVIKQLMIGRELKGDYYRSDFDGSSSDEIVLSVRHVSGQGLDDVSFDLHKGEILGIGGMSHCGMHPLGKILFGFLQARQGEVVTADGTRIRSVKTALKKAVGYVSKDRDSEALVLRAPIRDNIVSAGLDIFAKLKVFLLPADEKTYSKKQVDGFQIKCSSDLQFVNQLSGGNKQKVVFGKWIGAQSKILILDCPTRGIDVGVKQAMYQLMYRLKKEGISIIMISEEMAELIGMSDRLLVMKNGRIAAWFPRSADLSESKIIEYMV